MSNPSAPSSFVLPSHSAPSPAALPLLAPAPAPAPGLSGRPQEVEDRRLGEMELSVKLLSWVFLGAIINGMVGQAHLTSVGQALAKLLIIYVGIALVRVNLAKRWRIGL